MAKMQPFWWFLAPEVVCPSGEQIINGGFETGDFTGWEATGGSVTDQYARTGTYSAFQYQSFLRQTFTTSIPVSCVQSFKFYVQSPGQGPGVAGDITIHYTDDTTTVIDIECFESWHEYDLTAQLVAGKTIDYIEFRGGSQWPFWLDDVSLIGTG